MYMSTGDNDESVDEVDGDNSEESDDDADADAADLEPEDDPVCSKCYSNQHGI